jgi:hypothetical protein
MANVYIMGTHHEFQKDDGSKSSHEIGKFKTFLEGLCNSKGVRLIAEEMSCQALGSLSNRGSSCKQVADKLGLPHLYCDPESDEREQLRIREQDDIRIDGFFSGQSQDVIDEKIQQELDKRRIVWQKKLCNYMRSRSIEYPVLFICGARHALPFRDLLIEKGITCEVAIEDWPPNDITEGSKRFAC